MLDWLEKELQALEDIGGVAILLAHVPNLDECNRQFGLRYHAIMDRYQATIRWSMYGHEHQEQFQVQRDVIDGQPIGMNFIVGSATTFRGKPPSFNIVYVDPTTMLPVDYETYKFNLDEANAGQEPNW